MQTLPFAILLCWCLAQPALGQSARHDEGIAAGTAANAAIRTHVNDASAAAVVPGYTRSPPEAAFAGKGDLAARAAARLVDCAALPDDISCQAQRGALASANMPRPAIGAKDPAMTAAKAIARDPATVLGKLATYYSGCATPDAAVAATSVGNCPSNVFCLGASCFNTASASDTDFARMMSFLEAAREAGVYLDTDRLEVFKGEANACRDRLWKNCCASDSAGAGMTNRALFGTGSRLVYDVLTNADNREFLYQGVQTLLTGSGFGGSFTSYGVTVAVNGAPLPAGAVNLFASDSVVLAFDPWSLAITVTFAVVTSMASCSEEEGKLAYKEGARLCHVLGTWCSSCIRVLGKCVSCIERTTATCCFNSVLSRLINEQGRQQVGKQWGTPRQPDCSGFTIAQLQAAIAKTARGGFFTVDADAVRR